MGLTGMPNIGSPVMMPMTGFSGFATREITREMSYSSSGSRSGAKNGMASETSARLTFRPR